MKRKITLSLAFLQSFGLLAADYTAADVSKTLDTLAQAKGPNPPWLQRELNLFLPSFVVKTEKEYQAFREEYISNLYNALKKNTKPWWKAKSTAEKSVHYLEERLKRQEQNTNLFQKLTENATVLRKENLNELLKQTAELRMKEPKLGPRVLATRMAITQQFPDAWLPLECPKCHSRFYIVNGTNAPKMIPLSNLLSLLDRFDITPDYSTLCPNCHHVEPETPRLLNVTFTISSHTYATKISPADLDLLANCFIGASFRDENGQPIQPVLSPAQLLRLRAILQGADAEQPAPQN